jgi:pimeloyl-ACP methyl ester carboxylesterase
MGTTPATTAPHAELTTGSVTSADGTTIGYQRVGRGPAVVVLHGSNESAASHTQLAQALASRFTVYLPDRRGRGRSGPHRPGHSLRTEVEDLQAMVAAAGAQAVFGVSISGLIALRTALVTPAIRRIAAYEPALLLDRSGRYTSWTGRFGRQLASGQVAEALITSMFGFDLAPPALKVLPRRLLTAATNAAMKKEDAQASPGTVTMRQLAPTIGYEGLLLAEAAGEVSSFAAVDAEVLLIGGDMKRPAFIGPAFDALARTLPNGRTVRLAGLDHGGSSDPGPTNRAGQPAVVAPEVLSFFTGSAEPGQA